MGESYLAEEGDWVRGGDKNVWRRKFEQRK